MTSCSPAVVTETSDDNTNSITQDDSDTVNTNSNGSTDNWNPYQTAGRDIFPIDIVIIALNSAGENLLDPEVKDNLLDADTFYAEFRGKLFFLNQGGEEPTKDYLPVFRGLYSLFFDNRLWELRFGELDGELFYDNEDLLLYWPNGRIDTITFYNKLELAAGQEIVVDRRFYLNGEPTQNASFTIVLE